MIRDFEQQYASLITKVIYQGELRETRNATTRSIFGETLTIHNNDTHAPLLQGRKIFYKGVLGELAAMLRKPTCVADFERWGCNYWKQWGNADGSINVDYGNAWFEGGQIDRLKDSLANNPTDRRMIINGWRPERLSELSLPCCHYSYQFYVSGLNQPYPTLNMMWVQRSVDLMIGLPSDMVFAAAWLKAIAAEFGMRAGSITMSLGDVHIYEDHMDGAKQYLQQTHDITKGTLWPTWGWVGGKKDFTTFEPGDIIVSDYEPMPAIKFNLWS